MKVIVESQEIAKSEDGVVLVNLSRHPKSSVREKMDKVLDLFRSYGWEIEDLRENSDGGLLD